MIDSLNVKKILIDYEPFSHDDMQKDWDKRGIWPASWISGADTRQDISVAYRNEFSVTNQCTVRLHITADAHYRLFLNGSLIGLGAELGDIDNYFYDSYDIKLEAGIHKLVVLVFSYGELAPVCLMSSGHGLLVAAEGELTRTLCTGSGNWKSHVLDGFELEKSKYWIFGYMGGVVNFDYRNYPIGVEAGNCSDWCTPEVLHHGVNAAIANECRGKHLLTPGTLREKLLEEISSWRICQVSKGIENFWSSKYALNDEGLNWQQLKLRKSVLIPAYTEQKVLIDLGDYYCAFEQLKVSGGRDAIITIGWAEALFIENDQEGRKEDRNVWQERYFIGLTDSFIANGSLEQQFYVPWWRAGRYVMITVATGQQPLTIDCVEFHETRYPLEMKSRFHSSDEHLNWLVSPCYRTHQMCAHDTYMDCPYYEQLMYIGDARLQALINYTTNTDYSLAKKSIKLFASSRLNSGHLQSRYPSRIRQVIPPFDMLWIGMLHDYAFWTADEIPKELLSIAKGVIDYYNSFRNKDGLLENLKSWGFVDWALNWAKGVPPEGEFGLSCVLNWMFIYAIKKLTDLILLTDDYNLALYYQNISRNMTKTLIDVFWNEELGLFADNSKHDSFSEHAQSMAILSEMLPNQYIYRLSASLFSSSTMTRTTIYFSHYLFEAYRALERGDAIQKRLLEWLNFKEYSLKTVLERPEPSRSDCHAWSAHPLYHYFATILGIRPNETGFKSISISPQLGDLKHVSGEVPHPSGEMIKVYCMQTDANITVNINLPSEIPAFFSYKKCNKILEPDKPHTMTLDKQTGDPVYSINNVCGE